MRLVHLRRWLLMRFFHLLYHQLAWAYDAVSAAVSLGRWQEWGVAALPFAPGERVLEVGHGPGHLLAAMTAGGQRPIGLDLSPQMGRLAARRLAGLGLPVRLARGRGQALPFAASTFDAVIAVFPAPYILESATLAAIRHVLRPGGRLVIVPQAQLTEGNLPARAIKWLYGVTGQNQPGEFNAASLENSWAMRLSPAGFLVDVHAVEAVNSVVTVVVAVRPNSS